MPSASLSLIAAMALSFATLGSASPAAAPAMVCNADNALRALRATQKAAEATPFCRDYISIPVSTITVASTTPVTTVTSTSTALNTVIQTSLTTQVATVVETSTSILTSVVLATEVNTVDGPLATQTVFTTTTVAGGFIVGRGTIPIPTFMREFPESRISSACSCLSLPTITSAVTFTAPTNTVVVSTSATSVVSVDTTQTLSSTVTSVVGTTLETTILSTVSTTTTGPASTVTATALATATGCAQFYLQASGPSDVDGKYLSPKAAYAGYSDENTVLSSDVTSANKFCLDSQGRLIYQDRLYDNSGRSVYAFLNSGVTHEQLFFNSLEIVTGCGAGCPITYFARQNNVLTANNGAVNFFEACPLNGNPLTLYLSDKQSSGCTALTLKTVPVV
ncbi:hypothetical protein PVAG01_00385 [Phlyctema vagabunda]|uniref:Uncharacterized protein n=1 Tax=Phlyctema vagabunda TaxID=108571 RepID=A0ABR4PVI1_9HELO